MLYFCHILHDVRLHLLFFMLHIMSLCRYSIIKHPHKTRFLKTGFVRKMISVVFFLCLVVSCILTLSYRFSSKRGLLPNGMCLLIGSGKLTLIPMTVDLLTLFTHIISILMLPAFQLKVYSELKKHQKGMKETRITKIQMQSFRNVLFVTFTNILGHFPSACLICLTILWKEYPYNILIYSMCIVSPINTLFDPLIFVHDNHLKHFCSLRTNVVPVSKSIPHSQKSQLCT